MGHSSKKSQDSRDAKKDYKRDDKKDCRADYTGSSSEKLSKHSLDKVPESKNHGIDHYKKAKRQDDPWSSYGAHGNNERGSRM